MNEEKQPIDIKAMLAFVLLIAVVLLLPKYWEWLGYKSKPTPAETPADTTTVITDTSLAIDTTAPPATVSNEPSMTTATRADSAVAGSFVMDSAWTEERVEVETKYYSALLSTRGARLIRLVLKDYDYTDKTRRGEPVIIIDTTDDAGPRWHFARDVLDIAEAPFRVDRQRVNLTGNDSTAVHFTARTRAGNNVTLTYTFFGNHHDFGVALQLDKPWKEDLAQEYEFGWEGGLWPTEPNPKSDNSQFAATALMGKDMEKVSKVDREEPRTRLTGTTHWAAVRTKYFLCATIPVNHESDGFLALAKERSMSYEGETIAIKQFSSYLRMGIRAGAPLDERFTVYVGPVEYSLLKSYGIGLEDHVDLGWKWLIRPFALLLLWLFKTLHSVIPNYGLVIVVFSLLLKTIFHPLTKKSMKSMRAMQAVQPRMQKLRERYKDDAQRLNQEMMKLYKEGGVNPLSGCLPILPQMPIIMALWRLMQSSIELRGAPFVGWLTDLSQPDPYYVLPIIMTVAMFLQQRLSTKDPRQKMMTYILPLVFGFLFRNMAAGLNLYWATYNIFSVIEQAWLIGRPEESAPSDSAGEVGSGKIVKVSKKRSRAKKRT
jgi:YidC/Oxa1 family membrane protein insertase